MACCAPMFRVAAAPGQQEGQGEEKPEFKGGFFCPGWGLAVQEKGEGALAAGQRGVPLLRATSSLATQMADLKISQPEERLASL
jgi:hypothetical protein